MYMSDVSGRSMSVYGGRGSDYLYRSGAAGVRHDGFERFGYDYSWLRNDDWWWLSR